MFAAYQRMEPIGPDIEVHATEGANVPERDDFPPALGEVDETGELVQAALRQGRRLLAIEKLHHGPGAWMARNHRSVFLVARPVCLVDVAVAHPKRVRR